ncbi:MAG: di-trans,poly-cis-decaprenylcistransferase [Epsilonproteobacteria bacterium]|nr:di-trans,poly-cis-decaprenylcistransferase [Campylobacterota bacterium]
MNSLKHLAIIMDGNGRWAKKRGLPRIKGHEEGAKRVKEITIFCANDLEIETLTLYAFSTENWKRPKIEIDFLMELLIDYLNKELITFKKERVKFETIGDLERFPKKVRDKIDEVKDKTKDFDRLTQILALNYGARDEITRAVKRLISNNEEITQENISKYLDTPYSDIDLLIRTSGEIRLSNFLLWQISYSELFFTQTLWPDFSVEELKKIISSFKKRERKFGGL